MKVSVHIIAKEDTNLGNHFIDSCLNSIIGYADELVLIDNGCSEDVKATIMKFKPYFERFVYKESKPTDFASLRNACIENTGSDIDYFHWVDTDEVWFPVELVKLKSTLQSIKANKIATNLIHLMIDPLHFQEIYPKFNIFRLPKDRSKLVWKKGVHEMLEVGGTALNTQFTYLHFGYCREQWRICLRWLHYDILEHGHVNGYRQYNEEGKTVDYFKDWRTPDGILEDRKTVWKDYRDGFPSFVEKWLDLHRRQGLTWSDWVKRNDSQEFWFWWQELYKERGDWKSTLPDVVKRMGLKEKC